MIGLEFKFPSFRLPSHYPEYAYANFHIRNCRGAGDGKFVQTELTLIPSWNIPRRWIQQCTTHHRHFSTSGDIQEANRAVAAARFPARLLDVGDKVAKEPRLITADENATPYATLSYCWGKTRPLTTTSFNLGTHLNSIPFSAQLPFYRLYDDIPVHDSGLDVLPRRPIPVAITLEGTCPCRPRRCHPQIHTMPFCGQLVLCLRMGCPGY